MRTVAKWAIIFGCGLGLLYLGRAAGATASWWAIASGLIGGYIGGHVAQSVGLD